MDSTLFPPVGEIAQRHVCQLAPDATLRDAARLMHARGVSSVVVLHQGKDYLFTVEDLLRATGSHPDSDPCVVDLLTRELRCLQEDERVLSALVNGAYGAERYLGVKNLQGELVGIVTYTDILASIDPILLIEKKTIEELISHHTFMSFTPDWVLEDVTCHLANLEDAVFVVEDRMPVGVVTTRDLFVRVATGQSLEVTLGSIMTSPVVTVALTATIQDVLLLMNKRHIKRVVVVDERGEAVGVVTQSQLVGFAYGAWINLVTHHAKELRELVDMLEAKARDYDQYAGTDALTALPNRRVMEQRIAQESERVRRYRGPAFSMVMVEVAPVPALQHAEGGDPHALMLKAVATELARALRGCDLAARWSGTSFAVLLPQTAQNQAMQVLERLQQDLLKQTQTAAGACACCLVVSEWGENESMQDFLARLEHLLLTAREDRALNREP